MKKVLLLLAVALLVSCDPKATPPPSREKRTFHVSNVSLSPGIVKAGKFNGSSYIIEVIDANNVSHIHVVKQEVYDMVEIGDEVIEDPQTFTPTP